ncbi:MAG: hypothetical protein IJS10_01790, partial [Alphaproteobacteria bacterium]|nr:hypothetical protein [Alphaproteobacteria bacterium]
KGISVENSDGVINKFFDEYIFNRKIEQIYGGAYKENIERAFADIKQYFNELDLINYITNNEHFNEIYKTSQICVDYDKNGRARVTINNNKLYSKGLIYKIDGKTSCNDIEQIEIGIERNKIKNILLYDIYAIRYGEIDSYMNIKRGKVYEYYVYPYMNILSNQNCWQALQRLNNGSQIRYISLYPQKELREEGINVGWYLDSDEVYHLAWITKDDVYPKKSWVNPGDIKINIGYPKSYTGKEYTIKIDPQCIRDLTIEDYGDRIKKIDITAGDSLSAYDILDFEKLVTNSDSIRRFDTKLYLYRYDDYGNLTPVTKINKIFDNNKNLEYIAKIHSLTKIEATTMFENNPKLQPVEVKIDNEEEAHRNLGGD